ncbi:F0F1 ATP synthase subunit A [Gryllotalpicola sp.]|uniref:F0F1 ATP synthase subunit A n=1 Tax=Gryllotalpicola sp. TaxID=1932787 RepID=UPI0026166EBB|nr:F0F1 ATP synthase subunit A [Gryllotalpicola sp.]
MLDVWKQEIALITNAVHLLAPFFVKAADSGGFEGPSVNDFFPADVLFQGTPFALNRIMLIRLLVVAVLVVLMWLGTRKMKVVPGRGQAAFEFVFGFVRDGIIFDTLGEKDGKRFQSVLLTFFFVVLGMNLTGEVPGLGIAGTSVIGLPLIMALLAWVLYIYAGVKQHGLRYFKNVLFPPGVPWPLYVLLTPIEAFSTFILQPITLTLRLLMNMVAGHMLSVLVFSATQFFLFTVLAQGNFVGLLGVPAFAFGTVWLVFEIFVGALQAYVFTFLAAIYIQMAIADEPV